MGRLEFSRKVRRAIFERAAGKCESCRANLKIGEGEIDHILPAELGGKGEQANGQLLCHVCHGLKTRSDIRGIRKADRVRDKHRGVYPKSPRPLRSRSTFGQRHQLYQFPQGGDNEGT